MKKKAFSRLHTLKEYLSAGCLFLAALIWGVAFVAQSKAMEYVQPMTFNGTRGLITAVVLLPAWVLMGKKQPACGYDRKALFGGGAVCGLALFAASSLQQIALVDTSAGKSGFLTALYMIFVPLLGIFTGKRITMKVWLAVVLACAGSYLLCGGGALALTRGELCLIGSAFCYALQIMMVDRYVDRTNAMLLCCVQFTVSGVLSTLIAFTWENPSLEGLLQAIVPLLFAAIFSGAVAFTLQIVGQRNTPPAVASLLMSLESVFAAISGAILLHQHLTGMELIGSALTFAAVLLTQL